MLNTDAQFYAALRGSQVNDEVQGRIFNPARDEKAEQEDAIPYIVITLTGNSVGQSTKDDGCWQELSLSTVEVLVVAEDREKLALLTSLAYNEIKDYMQNVDEELYVTPSAGAVQLDPFKPCCYQTLRFECEQY